MHKLGSTGCTIGALCTASTAENYWKTPYRDRDGSDIVARERRRPAGSGQPTDTRATPLRRRMPYSASASRYKAPLCTCDFIGCSSRGSDQQECSVEQVVSRGGSQTKPPTPRSISYRRRPQLPDRRAVRNGGHGAYSVRVAHACVAAQAIDPTAMVTSTGHPRGTNFSLSVVFFTNPRSTLGFCTSQAFGYLELAWV
ncbi:hypothetical protein AAHC03_027173 [Spirometra sp. Aus1]